MTQGVTATTSGGRADEWLAAVGAHPPGPARVGRNRHVAAEQASLTSLFAPRLAPRQDLRHEPGGHCCIEPSQVILTGVVGPGQEASASEVVQMLRPYDAA